MPEETSTLVLSKFKPTTFIDPFVDYAFKRLFASEESKPILIGLLNYIFKGRKYIIAIEYGKNEYPGENDEEGAAIFDVICTDAGGSTFIIEIQRGYQENFIERGLFYVSRVISEQAPKGRRKEWAYNLTEVYLIGFLEDFRLPDSSRSEYVQDICLANRHTGKIFYDKMGMVFIEMLNFVKEPAELDTDLDRWLYALKHLPEFKVRPYYLIGAEFDQLFNLTRYTNLTREERTMYNASLKRKWDNKNVMDYAIKTADQKARNEERAKAEKEKIELATGMARKLKCKDMPLTEIVELTGLSKEEIEALD